MYFEITDYFNNSINYHDHHLNIYWELKNNVEIPNLMILDIKPGTMERGHINT